MFPDIPVCDFQVVLNHDDVFLLLKNVISQSKDAREGRLVR
jgi:hypothetical protein